MKFFLWITFLILTIQACSAVDTNHNEVTKGKYREIKAHDGFEDFDEIRDREFFRQIKQHLEKLSEGFRDDVLSVDSIPSWYVFETYIATGVEDSRELDAISLIEPQLTPFDPEFNWRSFWKGKLKGFDIKKLLEKPSSLYARENAKELLINVRSEKLASIPSFYLNWVRSEIPLAPKIRFGALLSEKGGNEGKVLFQIFFNDVEVWGSLQRVFMSYKKPTKGRLIKLVTIRGKDADVAWRQQLPNIIKRFENGVLFRRK